MKVLDVSHLNSGIDNTISDIESHHNQISAIQRAVRDFHALDDALKGKGGEAIRTFFNEVHQPFLIYLYQSMVDYKNILEKMKDATESFESHSSGFVRQEFLERDVERGFDKVKNETMELTDDANTTLERVQDLVSVKKIDPTEVLDTVRDGKKKAEGIVEELTALDDYGTSQLEQTKEDLQTMKSYLSDIESKFKGGGLSVSNFNIEAVKGIGAYKSIMDGIYSKAKEKSYTSDEKSIESIPLSVIEEDKNEKLENLSDDGKIVLKNSFEDLEDGEMDRHEYWDVLTSLKNDNDTDRIISAYESMFPYTSALITLNVINNMSASNGKEKKANDITKGEVVFEGGSNGQHEITKGVEGDLDSLGITYDTVRFNENEIEINYAIEDDKFIIFRDDPDLYYYTQSAEQGTFNYYVSGASKAFGQLYSAYFLKKGFDNIPGLNKITNMFDPKLLDLGKYGGSWWLKDQIPYVKDILGAEIPEVGNKEVILYVSEDGEKWNKGVRFVVKKDKDPETNKFTPNSW